MANVDNSESRGAESLSCNDVEGQSLSLFQSASTSTDSNPPAEIETAEIVPEPRDNNSQYVEKACQTNDHHNAQLRRKSDTTIYACIYALILTTVGPLIYVNYPSSDFKNVSEIFSTCMASVGLLWLIFLDFDLWRYKRRTYYILDNRSQNENVHESEYSFLKGRHSESVYLKVGLTAFFIGHLINEGLMLIQEMLNFMQLDRIKLGCGNTFSLIHHLIRIIYSSYQFCIVFKCSNLVINRYKTLARWALMHILASCLCFWFGTILEEALEDYHHNQHYNITKADGIKEVSTNLMRIDIKNSTHVGNDTYCLCTKTALLSASNLPAMPYLFPFTIEFNILLAGVWVVMWLNIGKNDLNESDTSNQNSSFIPVTHHSDFVIFADCHGAYKGLFGGICIFILSVITLIVFFVEMSLNDQDTAVIIHMVQECLLTAIALISVVLGFFQLSKLKINQHPIHIDDVLLFIPLPFFFIYATMTIIAEIPQGNVIPIILSLLIPLQVIVQTPFIIKSLRKCSDTDELRNEKPGRGVITFLTACNVTLWLINTFETKGVESHYGQHVYFGQFVWMFVSHTTLPFKLFYRFHSSACLADIWESAYKKAE